MSVLFDYFIMFHLKNILETQNLDNIYYKLLGDFVLTNEDVNTKASINVYFNLHC